MNTSEHAVHLTIKRGSHTVLIEVGANDPEHGFKPAFRKELYLPYKKHELVYAIVHLFQNTPAFERTDDGELPVVVTLVDGWTGRTYTLTAGRKAIKGKCYDNILSPRYYSKKMKVAEERKAIWQVGLLRLQLAKLRSGHWSRDKFLLEADFLLHC